MLPLQSISTAISPSAFCLSMAPIIISSWSRRFCDSRPIMPKSMKPMRLPVMASRLPGCGSAWNTPSISAICRNASVPFWASSGLSYSARVEPGMIGQRDAVQELLHQHALGRVFPVDLGEDDVVAVGEHGRQHLAVAALVDEVELAVDACREVAHLLLRLVAGDLWPFALDDAGAVAHQAQVRLDDLAQARPQHLDDDVLARLQPGPVDLGDRSRGDRVCVELGEDVFGRAAEILLELGPDLLPRHRRDLAVQAAEFLGPFGRQQVGAARQDLAELDEGRTQRLDGAARALGRRQSCDVGNEALRAATRAMACSPSRSTTLLKPKPISTPAMTKRRRLSRAATKTDFNMRSN